jgi:molybdopterin synthase sulfur carrier subunit
LYTVQIKIPSALRSQTAGQAQVQAFGATVAEALSGLRPHYAALVDRLLTEDGKLRSFVSLYLGSRNINTMVGLQTPLGEGAVLTLVQATVGG